MTEEIPNTESTVDELKPFLQGTLTSAPNQPSSPSDTLSPTKPLPSSDIQAASFTSNSSTHSSISAISLPTPPPFPLPNHPIWERQKVVRLLEIFTLCVLLFYCVVTERVEYRGACPAQVVECYFGGRISW